MSDENKKNITDVLGMHDLIKNDTKSQNGLDAFWARCIDVMYHHAKEIGREPPLWNKIMCVGFCAATWNEWNNDDHCRLNSYYDQKFRAESMETISKLRKEVSRLNAKLRRAKKKRGEA